MVRLLKAYAALDINIEQVHFAVAGNDFAGLIEHEAGVIQLAVGFFGDRAANEDDAVFPCPSGHSLHALAVFGIGEGLEILLRIWAIVHFRQHDDICAVPCRLAHHAFGLVHGNLFIKLRSYLTNGKLKSMIAHFITSRYSSMSKGSVTASLRRYSGWCG